MKMHRVLKTTGIAGAALFLAFTLFGLWGVPLIITEVIPGQAEKYINGSLDIQKASFNPFSFRLQLDGVDLKGPDKVSVLKLNQFVADFELTALLFGTIGFKSLTVDHPYIYGCRFEDNSINFQALAKAVKKVEVEKTNTVEESIDQDKEFTLPAIDIAVFSVSNGEISFEDRAVDSRFSKHIKKINFSIEGFSTSPKSDNLSRFFCATETGLEVEWEGNVMFNPLSSEGTVRINKFEPGLFAPYYQKFSKIEIESCVIGTEINYTYAPVAATPSINIHESSVILDNIVLKGLSEQRPFKSIDSIIFNGIDVDIISGLATMDSFVIDGGKLNVERTKDNEIDILNYLVPPAPSETTNEKIGHQSVEPATVIQHDDQLQVVGSQDVKANSGDEEQKSAKDILDAIEITFEYLNKLPHLQWVGELKHFGLHNQRVAFVDNVPAEQVTLGITLTALDVKNITNKQGQKAAISIEMSLDSGGTIKAGGSAGIEPSEVAFNYSLTDVDLSVLSPYVQDINNVTLKSGLLNTDGKVKAVLTGGSKEPQVEFATSMSIKEFGLEHQMSGEPNRFLYWNEFAINNIKAHSPAMKISVGEVVLRGPQAQIELDESGQISLMHLIPKSEELTVEVAGVQSNTEQSADHVTIEAPQEKPAVEFELGQFIVEDGLFTFKDESIGPGFVGEFSGLNLNVKGISSDMSKTIVVNFEGQGFNSGAFSAKATVVPEQEKMQLTAEVVSNFVPLTVFSPYTERFVGYNLDRGKLNLSQSYTINGNELNGRIKLHIDSIELGKFKKGKDVVSLPLKFGLSLLKDRNNQIKLPEIDLSGNLDDPKFSIGRLVWYTVSNIFIKAATSPFTFLASSFSDAEVDLSATSFLIASSELSQKEKNKLTVLADILYDRPQLVLKVNPQVNPALDGKTMKEAAYKKMYTSALSKLKDSTSTDEAKDAIGEEEVVDYLFKELYPKEVIGYGVDPDFVLIYDDMPEEELSPSNKLNRILEGVAIPEEFLYELAQQRGLAVKDFLMKSRGLAEDRFVVVKPVLDDAKFNGTGAFFELN